MRNEITGNHPSVARTISVFIQNKEKPKCWWKSQLFVLLEHNSILRQSFIGEQAPGALILRRRFAPNVFASVDVEALRIFLLNHRDRVFFAHGHGDSFLGQRVDNANASFEACELPDNVALISPPNFGALVFFLESRWKHRDALDVLIDSVKRLSLIVKGPAEILPGERKQVTKILRETLKSFSQKCFRELTSFIVSERLAKRFVKSNTTLLTLTHMSSNEL